MVTTKKRYQTACLPGTKDNEFISGGKSCLVCGAEVHEDQRVILWRFSVGKNSDIALIHKGCAVKLCKGILQDVCEFDMQPNNT